MENGVWKDQESMFIATLIQAATFQMRVHKIIQFSQKALYALAIENLFSQTRHTVSTMKLFHCRHRSVPSPRSCPLKTCASAKTLSFVSQSSCAKKMGVLRDQTPVLTCQTWLDLRAATVKRPIQSVTWAKPVEVQIIPAMSLKNVSIPCFYKIGTSF